MLKSNLFFWKLFFLNLNILELFEKKSVHFYLGGSRGLCSLPPIICRTLHLFVVHQPLLTYWCPPPECASSIAEMCRLATRCHYCLLFSLSLETLEFRVAGTSSSMTVGSLLIWFRPCPRKGYADPPPFFRSGSIFMIDAHSAESNEKSCIRFFQFYFVRYSN